MVVEANKHNCGTDTHRGKHNASWAQSHKRPLAGVGCTVKHLIAMGKAGSQKAAHYGNIPFIYGLELMFPGRGSSVLAHKLCGWCTREVMCAMACPWLTVTAATLVFQLTELWPSWGMGNSGQRGSWSKSFRREWTTNSQPLGMRVHGAGHHYHCSGDPWIWPQQIMPKALSFCGI